MTEKSEFIRLPETFENYRWYKPILVFIIATVIYVILTLLLTAVFEVAYGEHFTASVLNGGYEVMNSETWTDFQRFGNHHNNSIPVYSLKNCKRQTVFLICIITWRMELQALFQSNGYSINHIHNL